MQAYETAFEELPCVHAFPAAVVGIAYYEARKDEEEVNGYMAVVQRGYYSVSVTVCHFGERESFEYVVEKY